MFLSWIMIIGSSNICYAEDNIKRFGKADHPIRVLVLDSGGVHGIISNYPLQYLEEKSGTTIDKLFDVIVCVSTGAMQAAILTIPDAHGKPKYNAYNLFTFYHREVVLSLDIPWWKRFIRLYGLLSPEWDSDQINTIITNQTGDLKLSDLLSHVLILAYDLRSLDLVVLDNQEARESPAYDFELHDVIYGAITVPGKLAPKTIRSLDNSNRFTLMDGAIMDTDPTLIALSLVDKIYPNSSKYVLSIGTGRIPVDLDFDEVAGWGTLQWTPYIVHMVLDSRTVMTEDLVNIMYKNHAIGLDYYARVNMIIPEKMFSVFNASPQAVKMLDYYGKLAVATHKQQLDFFALKKYAK